MQILVIWKDNNLAQSDIVLLNQVNNVLKYHSKCQRKFTALPAKHTVSIQHEVQDASTSTALGKFNI